MISRASGIVEIANRYSSSAALLVASARNALDRGAPGLCNRNGGPRYLTGTTAGTERGDMQVA